jgi:hypothetical protein
LEIVYEPYKSLTVHEIVQSSIDNLVELQAIGISPKQFGRSIYWADGVAFIYVAMPPNDDVVKEQLKGRIHWSHLAFAFTSTYRPLMVTPDGKVIIPIINVSRNPIFKNLVKWLRENFKEE